MGMDLSQVKMLSEVPLDGLTALAEKGARRTFPIGTPLMRQREISDSMYIILKGQVRVERSHPDLQEPLVLAVLGPGEVVGEMGLLDHALRSATVIALEETETLELDGATLAQTMTQFPKVADALLHILSRRLRNTDELMEQMRRRERGQTQP